MAVVLHLPHTLCGKNHINDSCAVAAEAGARRFIGWEVHWVNLLGS